MQEAIRKADALIEALPYIQDFQGKTVVVKFGGSAMQDKEVFEGILEDVAFLSTVGIQPVVVHGGGARISGEMEERGLEPRFTHGHRITDEESLQVAVDVLSETADEIVAGIERFGAQAQNLFAGERIALTARKKRLQADGEELDLGFVGEVESVADEVFRSHIRDGIVPVTPPLGRDPDGQLYNINADTAAAAIAIGLEAEKLVLLSDVHGIMADPDDPDDPDSLLSTIDEEQAERLIAQERIAGGMLPKVRACVDTLDGGVHKAHIIDGHLPHSLLLEIFTRKGVGTQIVE